MLGDDAAGTSVSVSPKRGGIVTSFRVRDRELLYMDEGTLRDPTKNVRGGVPVLFPNPGRLSGDAFSFRGVASRLSQHGFARANPWTVVATGADGPASATLALADSATTRAAFPFPFHVEIGLSLRGASLGYTATVENTGPTDLPYALGFHPYFVVRDKAAARIDTRATRAFDNVTKKTGPFTGFDLAAGEVDLHLVDHGSADGALHIDGGTVHVRASADFVRWVVWTLPGKDFVCLEPWTAPGGALNTGESLTVLAPGATRTSFMEIAWEASG